MIRKLEQKEYDKVVRLTSEVVSSETNAGWSQKGGESVVSFLKERIHKYVCIGSFYRRRMNGAAVYDPNTFRLILLVVRKEDQKKGIGTNLIDAVVDEAKKQNVSKITVNAARNAVMFYEKYGFERDGEETTAGELTFTPMEYLIGKEYLGKTVTVIIDHPYGSMDIQNPDVLVPLNYGYVEEDITDEDKEFQEAYVYGPQEPLEKFTGIVIGIIYHRNDTSSRWIVAPPGMTIDQNKIIQTVGFLEQYYETRFIFA